MPGGVAFHRGGGPDRAGQITMVLLALLGVAPSDIAADYSSATNARRALRRSRRTRPRTAPPGLRRRRGTTASDIIIDTLDSLDVEAQVRTGGLTDQDLMTLRDRLVSPATSPAAGSAAT